MPAHDVNARTIVWTGAVIAATVVLAVVAALLLLQHWRMPPGGERLHPGHEPAVEGARLQSAPQLDLAQYREEKRKLLESSAWVDAGQGIVRIPISDAMDLMAQRAAR